MTREEAIKIIQNEYKCVNRECEIERSCGKCPYMMPTKEPILQAYEMAIQALSQEPTNEKELNKAYTFGHNRGVKAYYNEQLCTVELPEAVFRYILSLVPTEEAEQEPCDDAISRKEALKCINDTWGDYFILNELFERISKLPSVTQKSGKWDRLYNWLNDMRLGITPDETVDDIDERHCREAQTDILDEIMEWMIKAESEE